MDEIHRKILRENRTYLVQQIEDVDGITDVLLEKQIITNNMNQEIHAEKTKIAKVRKLLDTVPKRGKFAFETFCNALIKTGHRYIAEDLNPELKNSHVTAVPPEPESGARKTASQNPVSAQSSTITNKSKPTYPVPRQVGHGDIPKKSLPSKDEKKANLPDPAFRAGASSSGAGSQPSTPNDDRYHPVFGGQESGEATPNTPSDEDLPSHFPQPEADWPYKLDMTLSSKAFNVENCSKDEARRQQGDNAYPMEKRKMRRAVIISNMNFDGKKFEHRKLADMDSFRIQRVLKHLDFKIQFSTDVNKEDLYKVLEQEKEQDGFELCIFVLVILSYGGPGTIICTDGEMVPVQDIVNLFSDKNCKSMTGVPKLFLIQACGAIIRDIEGIEADNDDRAKEVLAGVQGLNLGTAAGGGKTVVDTKGRMSSSASESSLSELPNLEGNNDMLVAMATTMDMNHAQYSSLFMLGLSYIISKYAKSDHFITLLNGVNRLKQCEDSSEAMKLCELKSSLTKKLYLLPGAKWSPIPPGPFGNTKAS